MSGTIATMTDWGIRILSPGLFYVTAAVICALVALSIGSSWTVMGTIGVALIAISEALGVSMAMTAGAVVSGAYFGDKLSPLSETTNLAPAVAGTDLYTHIKAMMRTTIPSMAIALGLYAFFGLREDTSEAIAVDKGLQGIENSFNTGVLTLIPLVVVIILALRQFPPVVAVMAGAITGGLAAVFLQPDAVRAFVGETDLSTPWVMLKGVWDSMATGYEASTGFENLDELLSGGGMEGMLGTVWLIMVALAFGGVMNVTGMLARLIRPLRRMAKTDRGIVVATGATAISINALAADQYLAIVLTGNVYKHDFEEHGVAPQTLSRQIEDTATVTSPLIPWNSCGAYAAGVLNVTTLAYLPFAFFNWINPLLSFLFAALGIGIQKVPEDSEFPAAPGETFFYGVGGRHGRDKPLEGVSDEEPLHSDFRI
jgi:NhaC family Na+:H+ antiporter